MSRGAAHALAAPMSTPGTAITIPSRTIIETTALQLAQPGGDLSRPLGPEQGSNSSCTEPSCEQRLLLPTGPQAGDENPARRRWRRANEVIEGHDTSAINEKAARRHAGHHRCLSPSEGGEEFARPTTSSTNFSLATTDGDKTNGYASG